MRGVKGDLLNRSALRVLLGATLGLAACSGETVELRVDASVARDAAPDDAEPALDGSEGVDASPVPDAGLALDAQPRPDAESSPDSGREHDAGAPDVGVPDAGTLDAGTPDAGSPLAFQPLALPGAVLGAPYLVELRLSGGTGTGYAWTILQGGLPAGLALISDASSVAAIAGTATATPGRYSLVVRVDDDGGNVGSTAYDLVVRAPTPELVAMTGDFETASSIGAFLVDITPTIPTSTAIHPTASGGTEGVIDISPDGAFVAFFGDFQSGGEFELFLTRVTAGQPGATTRVSAPGEDVSRSVWTRDSTRLVYAAGSPGSAGPFGVHAIDVSGPVPSAPQPIGGLPGQDVVSFVASPVGRRVLVGYFDALYVVDLDALPLTAVRLSSVGLHLCSRPPAFTPSGASAIFCERIETAPGFQHRFVRADLGGVAPTITTLTSLMPSPSLYPAYELAPDGTALVFTADLDRPGYPDLYAVDTQPGGPSAPRRLTSQLGATDRVLAGFEWSPDSARLIFDVDAQVARSVYLVEAGAAVPTLQRVDLLLGAGTVAIDSGFSPGGRFVYFRRATGAQVDLFVRSFSAGALGPEILVRGARVPASFDPNQVFFGADDGTVLVEHVGSTGHVIHVHTLAGSAVGPARSVALPPIPGIQLGNYFRTRDPSRAVLSLGTLQPFVFRLYVADLLAPIVVPARLGPVTNPLGGVHTLDLEASGE